MMTIYERIADEIFLADAPLNSQNQNPEYREYHRQTANWLKELVAYRKAVSNIRHEIDKWHDRKHSNLTDIQYHILKDIIDEYLPRESEVILNDYN